MKTIIQVSDLHFGTENKQMIEILIHTLNSLAPDLIVGSGDFTQRARRSQFKDAQNFLKALTAKKLLVPGNHDIPLYDIFSRIFRPYERYKQYVNDSLESSFRNEEVAVLGLNSTTPFRAKNGHITEAQLERMRTFFDEEPRAIRIVVMHHNLIHLKTFHHPIANHETVIQKLLESNVNVVLSGHLHFPYVEIVSHNQSRLFLITAGTATSTRIRKGDNSFNLINIDKSGFRIDVYGFKDNTFKLSESRTFSFSA